MAYKNYSAIVTYIPNTITEVDFKNIFKNAPGLKSCRLMMETNRNNVGFGFLNFLTCEDLNNAMKKYNGMKIGHKNIRIHPSQPNRPQTKPINIRVKGFGQITEHELKNLFKHYGEILQVKILNNSGFIRFRNYSDGEKAILEMNRSIYKGSILSIDKAFTANYKMKMNQKADEILKHRRKI